MTEKKAILVVSFGTSYEETRRKTIEKIEQEIQAAYPEYEVRRAFTSRMIIRILNEREQLAVDTEKEALERLLEDGFREVIIQPTHVIHGFEYDKVAAVAIEFQNAFESLRMGRPLLSRQEDYSETAGILREEAHAYDAEHSGVIYMGHGSGHPANNSYMNLWEELKKQGGCHMAIGTVEGKPELKDMMEYVKHWKVENLTLYPLMIVAGDHACQDMASREEDSWKSMLEKEGYHVNCILKGLGEYEKICQKFVTHVREAEHI